MNATDFFGSNEWGAVFSASFLLLILITLCIVSKVLAWIFFALMLIAFIYSGYKLFFDKKNKQKGDFSELMNSFKK